MTNKDTLSCIDDVLNADAHYDETLEYQLTTDDDEWLIEARKAIEKQIPKKVKYLNRHGDGSDLWNKDYYTCPSCGRRLRNKQHDKHCGRCGQALEWGQP